MMQFSFVRWFWLPLLLSLACMMFVFAKFGGVSLEKIAFAFAVMIGDAPDQRHNPFLDNGGLLGFVGLEVLILLLLPICGWKLRVKSNSWRKELL